MNYNDEQKIFDACLRAEARGREKIVHTQAGTFVCLGFFTASGRPEPFIVELVNREVIND